MYPCQDAEESGIALGTKKIDRNKARDQRNVQLLLGIGWSVLTAWVCRLQNTTTLQVTIVTFFEGESDAP